MMKSILLLSFASFAAFMTPLAAYGQSEPTSINNPMEAHLLEQARLKFPDFRIVKKMEDFPERYNASIKLPIEAASPTGSKTQRALVTLHDGVTGEPMESCYTPCSLHKSPGRSAFIFAYKLGHVTFPTEIELDPLGMHNKYPYWDGGYEVKLGPDFRRAFVRGKMCETAFAKMDRNDRDAQPCYRMPPPVPNVNYSGYCRTTYDITPKGSVTNARVTDCSDEIFKITSLIAVMAWKYHPKVDRGMAVTRPDVKTLLRYDITDFDGALLDEAGNRVDE